MTTTGRVLTPMLLVCAALSAQTTIQHGKQTFKPSATVAGLSLECAALPSSPSDGDIVCDSADGKVKLRSNGAWVDATSAGDVIGPANTISDENCIAVWTDVNKTLKTGGAASKGWCINSTTDEMYQRGTRTAASALTLLETSANGENFRKLTVPTALTADLTLRFPDALPANSLMRWPTPTAGVSEATFVGVPKLPIGITIDGGGEVITTGIKGYRPVGEACTISKVTLLETSAPTPISSSAVIDIWVDTYANYPPTVADTITASAKPTLATAIKAEDSTLTGWTKPIAAGSIIGFNVDSVTAAKRLLLMLECDR